MAARDGYLLEHAQEREVYDADGQLYVVECYTVPEAARAIGRTQLTLKRWIKDGLIPEPYLVGATYGYHYISAGELQVIANILKVHEQQYDYLHHTHTMTVNRIWQEVEQFRKEYL